MIRGGEHRGRVGAAWRNADGTIGIRLNPFVVLSAADDLVVTLFPADRRPPAVRKSETDVPY